MGPKVTTKGALRRQILRALAVDAAGHRFDEVKAALRKHWGLSLHRGGDVGDGEHDGRWDVAYSRTGYVVGRQLPGLGHGYRRFATLVDVVSAYDLGAVIARCRRERLAGRGGS